jgi:P27 family predicted phage terminase small subunit
MNLQSIEGGDGVPAEPDWQSLYDDELDIAEANEQWGIITREMKDAGTLTVANGHAIRRLVEFRVQYQRASRHVAEKGAILKGKRAKVGQWNPYWSVMSQAQDKITALEKALGISPDARSKAGKVQRAKKTSRAADAYLGKAGG